MSSDVRALGRLSESLAGGSGGRRPRRRRVTIRRGMGPARRRPLVPRSVLAVIAVALSALVWVAMAADGEPDASAPAGDAQPADVPARPAGEDHERASRGDSRDLPGATFAQIDSLRLTLPYAQPPLVVFGEADRAEALPMEPLGRLVANEHDRYEPSRDVRGPDYRVLASRGKARPATSSADVVMPQGATVLSPVTGRVVRVRDYAMEGGVRDYRVVIEVADQPSLHVLLSYVEEPSVTAGDAVRAGESPIGSVRLLPFTRHVDDYLDERLAHVRIEVQPAGEPDPPDPNEPAVAPVFSARDR